MDALRFKSIKYSPIQSLIKRNILSDIAAISDPLQLLASITIGMKILMQKICQSVGWDNLAPEDMIWWYETELPEL